MCSRGGIKLNKNQEKLSIVLAVILLAAGLAVITEFNALQDRVAFVETNGFNFSACDENNNCQVISVAERSLELTQATNNLESRIVAIESFLDRVAVYEAQNRELSKESGEE